MARVIFDPTGLLSDTQELDHHARAVSVSTWNASAPSARIFVGQKQGPKYGLPFTTNSRPGRSTGPIVPWLLSLEAKSNTTPLCRLWIALLLLHGAWKSKGSVSWGQE
jgi:hypothetical protein